MMRIGSEKPGGFAAGPIWVCCCLLAFTGCKPADRHDAAIARIVAPEENVQSEPGTGPSDVQRSLEPDRQEYWSGLGIMIALEPKYEGAAEYGVRGYPIIDLPVGDPVLLDTRNGLGLYLLSRSGVKIGAAVGYRFGRDEDVSDHLDGMGDVRGGLTANGVLEYHVKDFRFGLLFERQITGDATGSLFELTGRHDWLVTRRVSLRSTLAFAYADDRYMDSYFGVDARQSGDSGLPLFHADPGIKSVGLQERLVFRLSSRWSLHAAAQYQRLVFDAADSPVSADSDQFLLGWGVSWRF